MSFLGNTPTSQSFTSTTERFNGDGSTTTFTMSRAVFTAGDIEVIVNNVQQDPFDAYTVNGTTTLTFTGAPSVGTGNILVTYRNYIVSVVVPAQGTVTNSTLAAAAITGDKIGLTAITGNLVAAAAITGDKIGLTAITSNLIASGVTITSPVLITPNIGTPSSGILSSCTVDGTDAVGFRNIPQNSQSAAYTLVLADAGKHIFHPSGDANARTYTIPANSSVAYPIGTAITFVNMTSNVVTIAITTDTMYLAKDGTTGSRSLAQYGSATALKITSTNWLISGSALT